MAGKLNAHPEFVQDAATIAGDIRARLQGMADAARAAVAPGQAAWGDDDFGRKFAEGDKGFVTGSANMAAGTENLSDSFGNLTSGLQTSAQRLTAMEHGNRDGFA
ncbi:hypothetical protein [Nocardia sp. NBC_01327]|uniref:hypothetical protein n=1 Tax=Nocardia sp. NBC_01327 TaxID=2903593 RepID=UPI002E138BA7|nr:hypothetical protein OG326_38600 [Nocardia sp. NBC_01327]